MMKDQKLGGGKGDKEVMEYDPEGSPFMQELSLLKTHSQKIVKIESWFVLYRTDFEIMDFNKVDNVLRWMVDLLYSAFVSEKNEATDKLWALSCSLRKIYGHILPILYNGKWLFPRAKEAMLRLILDRWETRRSDEQGRETLLFIWSIYNDKHPLDERKIIDKLIREKLNIPNPGDVERWIKWIYSTINSPSTIKEFKIIHEDLAQLFTLARARLLPFDSAAHDVLNSEMVAQLGLWDTEEAMFPVLSSACSIPIQLDREFNRIVGMLSESLERRMYYEILPDDYVKISVINNMGNIPYNLEVLRSVENEMREFNMISTGANSSSGRKIILELIVSGESGENGVSKKWDKEG